MTTFVQLGEQDNVFDLVTLVHRLNGLEIDEQAIANSPLAQYINGDGDFAGLIQAGVLTNNSKLFNGPEADVDALWQLAFSCIPRITTPSINQLIESMLPVLASAPMSLSPLNRLQLLTQLYNVLCTLSSQPNTHITNDVLAHSLLTALRNAVDSKLGREFAQSIAAIEKLINRFEASRFVIELQRSAYDVCHQSISQAVNQTAVQQQQSQIQCDELLFAYLRRVDKDASQAPAVLNTAMPYVQQAALSAISSHLSYGSSINSWNKASPLTADRLLGLKPVQALTRVNSADSLPLFELLRILATADINSMSKFTQDNAAFMKKNDFDATTLYEKVQTLKLCDLALAAPELLLSFDAIASGLGLKGSDNETIDEQVERCVVEAILTERLDAKIDQQKRRVQVSRVHANIVQVDPKAQSVSIDWTLTEAKLNTWKTHLTGVMNKLERQSGGDMTLDVEDA